MFGAYCWMQITPDKKHKLTLNSIPSDNPVALEFTIAIELKGLVFAEGGKRVNPEKILRTSMETMQQQIQPTYETGSGIQTQATLAVVECSHHLESPTDKRTILYLCSFVSIISWMNFLLKPNGLSANLQACLFFYWYALPCTQLPAAWNLAWLNCFDYRLEVSHFHLVPQLRFLWNKMLMKM